ncbi:hypothetical protein QJS04_geneDACA012494 [Acorus gramineus]|uniref:Ubiquinol-cytochrome c chaperone domain-containing protein n=1 Tax=Acorus gramineus TaxID=55184 RepID=A0AAV9BA33_ACOGR|nr:hypothetical protein QJS04_geneDACA012494 [Acorus gramineus]
MLSRWSSRAATHLTRHGFRQTQHPCNHGILAGRSFAKVAPAAAAVTTTKNPPSVDSPSKGRFPDKSETILNAMFLSKPCSLALAPNSPLRVEEPKYEGIRRVILKLLLFYSKQSRFIRGANVIYDRIISQVDKPGIYAVFRLEKTFKTTFSLLILHMWLCLRRLKEEGKEGVELGQYLYEIYNHDLEIRVSKAGVNLLLTRWMKELEKIFYGNILAYDKAMSQESKQDDLQNVIWRNVFSDDGLKMPNDASPNEVKAMARYACREFTCLSLTDKEAMFSGNFMFTRLEVPNTRKPVKHT